MVLMPTKYVGNFVISLRTLEACIQANGVDDTVFVIDEYFEPLFRAVLGDQPELIIFPRSKPDRLRRIVRFFGALRRQHFDHVLDLDGTVVSGRIARFARGTKKIGPGFAKRPGVYDQVIDVDRDTQHCFDDYVQLAAASGIHVADHRYRLIPAPGDSALPLPIDKSRPAVCLHPSATKDYKQWDIEKFAALADRFDRAGWQVIVVGAGAGEAERVDRLLSKMSGQAINAHNKLSLLELVRVVQASRLYIGNDSGPMHLAAASGTPVLALFGPTELIRWRPRAEQVDVIKGSAPCSWECQPEACVRAYQCMETLTTDAVINRASTLIGQEID